MKGFLVQTNLHGIERIGKIILTGKIGTNSKTLGSQPPEYKDKPLIFCSYITENYQEIYGGDRAGIIFETDSPIVYACPVDSFELMRGGNYLPGHEKFLFKSIEEMLRRYPRPDDFKQDFQNFFRQLRPQQVYPRNDKEFATEQYESDYCLETIGKWKIGCNEITFQKPLKIKNTRIFNSKAELEMFIKLRK